MQQQLLTESDDESNVASQNGALRDAAPQNVALRDAVPQNGAIRDVAPRNVALRDVPPQNVAIGEMAPHIVAHQRWKDPALFPNSIAGKAIFGCSITQLVSAVLILIFEIASIVYTLGVYRLEFLIKSDTWTLIIVIIAGSFGIAAGRKKRNKCLIIAHMVLSIISSVAVIVVLAFAIWNISAVALCRFCNYLQTFQGLQIGVLLCGLAIAVSSIVSSAFCCRTVCCCNKSSVNRNYQVPIRYVVANQSHPLGAPGYGPSVVVMGQPPTGAPMHG